MHHFLVQPTSINGGQVTLDKTQAHHINNVLRLSAGDAITVADNSGRVHLCELRAGSGATLTAVIVETTVRAQPLTRLTLCMSLLKGAKMELVVQKATELGVDEIVPFVSSRSVSRPPADRMRRKADKLATVALAAAEQSRRATLPEIRPTASWQQMPAMAATRSPVLVAWEEETETTIEQALPGGPLPEIALVVGPEGGLSGDEVAQLVTAGATAVTLGPNILRAETAALAMVAIVRHITLGRSAAT